jgi:hypothetical protein
MFEMGIDDRGFLLASRETDEIGSDFWGRVCLDDSILDMTIVGILFMLQVWISRKTITIERESRISLLVNAVKNVAGHLAPFQSLR